MLKALIKLSRGKIAIVDKEDFEWLNQWKWTYHSAGYAYRQEHTSRAGGVKRHSKCFLMHREIMKAPLGCDIDHVNGNKLDNRKNNLRICDMSHNLANRGKQKNNTSGYKGVYWHNQLKRWFAAIQYRDKHYHLGLFDSKEEASVAYKNAAKSFFGEFAHI